MWPVTLLVPELSEEFFPGICLEDLELVESPCHPQDVVKWGAEPSGNDQSSLDIAILSHRPPGQYNRNDSEEDHREPEREVVRELAEVGNYREHECDQDSCDNAHE